MNRNLLLFSLFLILAGLAFNLYLVSFFGFLMLIPALVSTSNPPRRPVPSQAKQAPKRIIPPEVKPEAAPVPTPSMQAAMAGSPSPMQTQTYSPALFPSSFMPTFSQIGTTPQMAPGTSPAKQDGRDELVEVGTILVLLKLFFG